jgi:rod shape-determining protein MreD
MDTWVRHAIPVGTTLLLLLLTAVPTRLPGLDEVMPVLPLMGVYYWAILRPDLLPAWAAFLIGLLYDILSGLPMGVHALVLLLVQGIAASQQRFFLAKSFLVSWWAFGLLSAGATALTWMLISMLYGKTIAVPPVLIQYAITLGLFPVLTWTLARTQMAFLKDV